MKLVMKKPTFKAKEVQKMLQWIKMDLEEYQWAKQANLDTEWFTP